MSPFLATILVERLNTLLPTATTAHEQAVAGMQAFHAAIIGAVVLCIIGAFAALFLHDEDAAPTMRPRVVETEVEARRHDLTLGDAVPCMERAEGSASSNAQERGSAERSEGHAEPWARPVRCGRWRQHGDPTDEPHNGVRRSEGRSMVMRAIEAHHEVVERAAELAVARLDGQHGERLAAFIRQYYARVAPDDIGHRDPADLYGAALAHWRTGRKRRPAIPRACGSTTPTSRPTAGRAATRWSSSSATTCPSSSTR